MHRSALLPFALAAAAAVAPVATAATPTRVGVDRERQVGFTVEGRSLLVNLRSVDGRPNPLVADVSGADVVLVCRGKSPKSGRELIADREAVWPAGDTQFRARLSRDISDGVRWCVLEEPDGTDIAVALKMRVPSPTAGH